MIRLMVKIHNVTGQKYLCKSERINYIAYRGSGPRWNTYLKENGENFSTIVLYESEDKADFKRVALMISTLFDVVRRDDFSNDVHENGFGGDTVSSKLWITNNFEERYHNRVDKIPEGWKRGRLASTCKFKDPEYQLSLIRRTDRTTEKYKDSRMRAGAKTSKNRDHSKCGRKGGSNPMAKGVIIRGSHYDTMQLACNTLGIRRPQLKQLILDGVGAYV